MWGDGTAIRAYTYVSDLVEGIYLLMHSDLEGPVNIGSSEYVTVDELVETVIEVSSKEIRNKYVEGPVGVQARNPSTRLRQAQPSGSGQGSVQATQLRRCPEFIEGTRLRAPLQQGAHSLVRVGSQGFPQSMS